MNKIAVIGESCSDQYVYGSCDRVCPEAAAICFTHTNEHTTNPGMAGNVYANLKALDKKSTYHIDLITTPSTIVKKRFVDKKYNTIVFREDINDFCDNIIIDNYDFSSYDIIIISDYCKGFLTEQNISHIGASKNKNCVIFMDTKKQLHSDYTSNINYIKINNYEFKQQNPEEIISILEHSHIIITQGENGACILSHDNKKYFSTDKILLRDVCGAGDTFLAALAIDYINHKNIDQAIHFANKCAGLVVSKFGVTTV